jgi:hypothetical protein
MAMFDVARFVGDNLAIARGAAIGLRLFHDHYYSFGTAHRYALHSRFNR